MQVPLSIVDAFTSRPFSGNPAAVCLLPHPAGEEWMQQVAAEMNLSETAFLSPAEGGYDLRWFTPLCEVDLCGHATLATAHVLRDRGDDEAVFFTKSGPLRAFYEGDLIVLDFPGEPAVFADPPPGLIDALGIRPVWTGKNRFDYLVEVASGGEVRAMQPDFSSLARITARGVMVTAETPRGPHDFISRFFAPAVGIPEDPVTGSAHCCLGPYWKQRTGRNTFTAWQASPRGGEVRVEIAGDRVLLGGRAVTVLEGRLRSQGARGKR
ncbi:MAG: PhzF family phenazine biosynthesis protein [Methanomicrobiaceae archaeon]|nr:PhzF family phenazine biosynthesis protein [Methanomicrobiaceae archaeon]